MPGQSQWLSFFMSAVILTCFGQTTIRTSNGTLIQTLAPDPLRGRVQSIYHFDHGFSPLASFVMGLFAQLTLPPEQSRWWE